MDWYDKQYRIEQLETEKKTESYMFGIGLILSCTIIGAIIGIPMMIGGIVNSNKIDAEIRKIRRSK